mgnify:CR=1 FL=1
MPGAKRIFAIVVVRVLLLGLETKCEFDDERQDDEEVEPYNRCLRLDTKMPSDFPVSACCLPHTHD